MSTGSGMQGIAIWSFGPVAVWALFTGNFEIFLLTGFAGAIIFWWGYSAEQEVLALKRYDVEPVQTQSRTDSTEIAVFELSCVLTDFVDEHGIHVLLQPGWFLQATDTESFEIVRSPDSSRASLPLHLLLDREKWAAWDDLFEEDSGPQLDWTDETNWSPADAMARSAISVLLRSP